MGFEYWTLGKVERAAARLATFVDEVKARTGATQVDLIGHSMGGIVGRCFVGMGGGAPHVRNLVTIGSPHNGTPMSRFGVGAPSTELRGGSALLAALADTPIPPEVRVTNIWSKADGLVSSHQFAHLPGADEVRYDDLGHLSLLASKRVAREIVARLKR